MTAAELNEKLRTAKDGDELAPNVVFLGWHGIADRNPTGAKCPRCRGFADPVDSTPAEIASDLNCGRGYACCCAAFECSICGARLVGRVPAPEMD